MRATPTVRLAVAGVGAATAVGLDAVSAAAAIRAGITRPSPIVDPEILDEDTQEMIPVLGHPVAGLTDGFVLLGRWSRLARVAFEDLLRALSEEIDGTPGFWQRTAFLLAIPTLEHGIFLEDAAIAMEAIRKDLMGGLFEDLRIGASSAQVEAIPFAQASGAMALLRARELISGGQYDRALVLGIDSLIDPLLIENLMATRALKVAGNPVGLAPGEAAVALLVEERNHLIRRGGRAQGLVAGLSATAAPARDREEYIASGRGLADDYVKALDDVQIDVHRGELYLDLNGEDWRARQWGAALVRIQGRYAGAERIPAVNVGDTGAASGALSVLLAVRSFARGYPQSDAAMVLSSSASGHTGAILILRPVPSS